MPDDLDPLRQQLADLQAALADLAARVAQLETQVLLLTHQDRERLDAEDADHDA